MRSVRMALSPNVGLKPRLLRMQVGALRVRMALSPNVGLKPHTQGLCHTHTLSQNGAKPECGIETPLERLCFDGHSQVRMALSPNVGLKQ